MRPDLLKCDLSGAWNLGPSPDHHRPMTGAILTELAGQKSTLTKLAEPTRVLRQVARDSELA